MIAVEMLKAYENVGEGEIAGFNKKTVDFLVENKIAKVYKQESKEKETKVSKPDTKK